MFVKLSPVEHGAVRGRTEFPRSVGKLRAVPADISLVVAVRLAIQGGSQCFKTNNENRREW